MARRISVQPMTKSIKFKAATDKIDCGTDFIGTGDITVCGWFNRKGLGGGNLGRIMDNGSFLINTNNVGALLLERNSTYARSENNVIANNKWYFFSATSTSDGTTAFRINGVANTYDSSAGIPADATTNLFIGNRNAGDRNFDGLIKNLRVFNRILTTSEQDEIYYTGTVPEGCIAEYTFENDTSATAFDTAGGHNGTITGATFSTKVPLKERKQIGGNLVYNGDFEKYSLGEQVATTTSARWIDGTASNSLIGNVGFGWHTAFGGTAAAIFDTSVKHSGNSSLKLIAGTANAGTYGNCVSLATAASPTLENLVKYYIKVKPSTSYTLTAFIKTSEVTNVNAGSTNAAHIRIYEYKESLNTSISSNVTTNINGTNDWTKVTKVFTTNSLTRRINIWCLIFNETGTAWFDDISLVETTPPTRTASGTRTSAVNRTSV